ncbi:MAG TPA: DUF1707 domain-containing protein [Solirubrobacteraceae bacterium]|jgi:hypothetical protein|nr:DUF1707 domain-containing protein [Solirubrobacteraceae bacterium]
MFRLFQEDIRASDADRDETAELLKRHYADGRLSSAELSARVEAAYAAVRLSELDALLRDLPPLAPSAVPQPPATAARAAGRLVTGALAAAVLLVAAAALPAEAWAMLLVVALPIVMLAAFTVLPIALPVLAIAWLVRALGGRPQARLERGRAGVGTWYSVELEPRRQPVRRAGHPDRLHH